MVYKLYQLRLFLNIYLKNIRQTSKRLIALHLCQELTQSMLNTYRQVQLRFRKASEKTSSLCGCGRVG